MSLRTLLKSFVERHLVAMEPEPQLQPLAVTTRATVLPTLDDEDARAGFYCRHDRARLEHWWLAYSDGTATNYWTAAVDTGRELFAAESYVSAGEAVGDVEKMMEVA